jgi:hypothetical protein
MTYPHDFGDGQLYACKLCHCLLIHTDITADCPAAMLARIAELEAVNAELRTHDVSMLKAQARAYDAGKAEERAAVVRFLHRAATSTRPSAERAALKYAIQSAKHESLTSAAVAIEAGEHYEQPTEKP